MFFVNCIKKVRTSDKLKNPDIQASQLDGKLTLFR